MQRNSWRAFNHRYHNLKNGTDVVLGWGFWKKKEREDIDSFFSEDGIDVEWHYIDVSDEKWMEHIGKRNQGNEGFAYFLPKEVLQRTEKIFEIPDKEDIDVWIKDWLKKYKLTNAIHKE